MNANNFNCAKPEEIGELFGISKLSVKSSRRRFENMMERDNTWIKGSNEQQKT